MSDVPEPRENLPLRVLPKVFADVPSAIELDTTRRSRNTLALLSVLLVGMLITSVAALLFLWNDSGAKAEQDREEIELLEQQVEGFEGSLLERDEKIAGLEGALKDAVDAVGEFAVIDRRLEENDAIRGEIGKILEKKPKAKYAVRPNLGSGQSVYDRTAWLEKRDEAEKLLQSEQEELDQILDRVTTWTPINDPRPR